MSPRDFIKVQILFPPPSLHSSLRDFCGIRSAQAYIIHWCFLHDLIWHFTLGIPNKSKEYKLIRAIILILMPAYSSFYHIVDSFKFDHNLKTDICVAEWIWAICWLTPIFSVLQTYWSVSTLLKRRGEWPSSLPTYSSICLTNICEVLAFAKMSRGLTL